MLNTPFNSLYQELLQTGSDQETVGKVCVNLNYSSKTNVYSVGHMAHLSDTDMFVGFCSKTQMSQCTP